VLGIPNLDSELAETLVIVEPQDSDPTIAIIFFFAKVSNDPNVFGMVLYCYKVSDVHAITSKDSGLNMNSPLGIIAKTKKLFSRLVIMPISPK
jgi:hypothetical protein